MIRRLIILLLIVGCVFAREYIAIIDFEGIGVGDDEARALTQRLTSELITLQVYQVVERSDMKRLLDEQKFQYSGCVDTKCAVEIGKMIGAKYMVVGSISKIDDVYTIDTRLINVESSEAYTSGQYTSQESLSNVLVNGMKSIAYQLCEIDKEVPMISIINSDNLKKRNFGINLGMGEFFQPNCDECRNSPFCLSLYFNFNKPLKHLQFEMTTISDFGLNDYHFPTYFGLYINKYFNIENKLNFYLGTGYNILGNPIPERERLGLHSGLSIKVLSISYLDLYFGGNLGCSIKNSAPPIFKYSSSITTFF